MRRRLNHGVVYTGLVGSRLRPLMTRRRPMPWKLYPCHSGPWRGHKIVLDPSSGIEPASLPLVIGGQRGRYIGGYWEPAS